MKVASSEQMRRIDRQAIDTYGIPGVVLMENAGLKVCKHIINEDIKDKKICIICGKGNNGGDGFVAARHLSFKSRHVATYLIGDEGSLKGDALVNYNIAKNMGLAIKHIRAAEGFYDLITDVNTCDVLIDGLLGTGVRGEVTGIYRDVISIINKYASFVISIDIPSGIDADTGKILGEGVRANKTVTFALPKIGLYTYPGADYAGEVIIEDISIPHKVIEEQNINANLLFYDDVKQLFPKRKKDTNKGTYGRAFLIGGSYGMMGAVAMCGMSALRCGTGIVELGVPSCIQQGIAPLVMEAIVRGFDDEEGKLSYSSGDSIVDSLKRSSGFAIGPGLSKSKGLMDLLRRVIKEAKVPGVIDADGLNLLSEDIDLLYDASCTMVVTPHPGEMARLMKKDIGSIQSDRIETARGFSKKYKVVTVLKGAHTVVSSTDGEIFINTTGNPGMAKGGSGDVLTGMIASFLAQGLNSLDAARAGVYIHGLAGDMACRDKGEYGLKAGDIIDCIPNAINLL